MLAGQGDWTNIVHRALASEYPIETVVLESDVPRAEFLRRRVQKLGPVKVAGQMLFRAIVVPSLRVASRRRIQAIHERYGLDVRPIDESTIVHVSSVNSEETIQLLKKLAPALVLVNGTRIISGAVLRSVPAPFVNVHAGITPLYRGVHGAYWALVHNDRRACGVSVHVVDEGIDTGGILGQATIDPTAEDNFVTYPYLQLAAAIPLLRQVIRDLLDGRVQVLQPPTGPSRIWTLPTIAEYIWNRLRHGAR